MNVAVFGASGMIGGGVTLECLRDPRVESVVSVGRRPSGLAGEKLEDVVVPDLFRLGAEHGARLGSVDACFYCLGVSSAGMAEDAYRRVTVDLTVAVLDALLEANPDVKVCFVSGQGSDGSGRSRMMWARVKGEAENEVLARPIEAYVFRPGFVQPLEVVRSSTTAYRVAYGLVRPITPLLVRLLPGGVTTTVRIGRAMLAAVTSGYPRAILETRDINALGTAAEVT